MLTLYEKKILKIFSEAYPLSAHYRNGGRRLRKGDWNKTFPETERKVENKEAFLDAVESLCSTGVLSASWQKFRVGDKLVALYLEDPEMLYRLLKQPHPEILRDQSLAALRTHTPVTKEETLCRDYFASLLEARGPLPVHDDKEMFDILKLLTCKNEETGHLSIRALSVELFNDSKRIEKILKTADRITELILNRKISFILGLSRVYPETTLAGDCIIRFRNGKEWSLDNKIITLPLSSVEEILSLHWNEPVPELLVIENKETFYLAVANHAPFSGFLYTSGHLNSADTALFNLIKKEKTAVRCFCDLDPGGILIFRQIYDLLEGSIAPYLMDTAVYNNYLPFGYTLSPNELKKIKGVGLPPLQALIERILETGMGIEQEVIRWL